MDRGTFVRLAVTLAAVLAAAAAAESHTEKTETRSASEEKAPDRKYVEWPGQPGLKMEIEGKTRRVIVPAEVVLREGSLELLATKKGAKEHESILAIAYPGEILHTMLLTAGADIKKARPFQAGKTPVVPSGSKVKVTVRYEENGKRVEVPAQQWIRDSSTKKPLAEKWVFTGSRLLPPPAGAEDKRPRYAADVDGDFFSVSNFEGSILDLPIASSADDDKLQWEANTEKIPKVGTKVTLVLEVEK